MANEDLGELILGAKPLARRAFKDERRWRSMYTPAMRREFGLFDLAGRLAGFGGIIDRVLADKVRAAMGSGMETAA